MITRLFLFLFLIVLSACKKEKLPADWQKIEIPVAQDINEIQFVTKDTGYMAGGKQWASGVVLKTTDGGQSWNVIFESREILTAAHAISAGEFITCTYVGTFYITKDGGQTWDSSQFDAWLPVHDIAFLNSALGYAAGGIAYEGGYILMTDQGGFGWLRTSLNYELRSLQFVNDSTGFAAGYGIILKTTDAGKSWDTTTAKGDFFMDIYFVNEQTGYAVGNQGDIIKTDDGGKSWEKLNHGHNFLSKKLHFNAVHFVNEEKGIAVADNGIVLKTTDGGKNWSKIKIEDKNLNAVFFIDESSGFIAGDDGVVYRVGF